jgi:ABC-2 type transport system ATP-binding protein
MEQVFRQCMTEAKAGGQTVFLSSHILSEVEALCDRVAILRMGELLEIGTLDQMRHLSELSVEAVFTGMPPDLHAVPGVTNVQVVGQRLHCQVAGSMEPLLRVLSDAGVTELISTRPSLEELFLSHYGAAGPMAGGTR